MQSIKQCAQRFISNPLFYNNNWNCLLSIQRSKQTKSNEKFAFLKYNDVIFPPQKPGEETRPGFVCHAKRNVAYSPKKMWYIAAFVRGMTVDEAVKQLSFMSKKGAAIIKEIILEAQDIAIKEHNIEFKSNLWVAESFATKGAVYRGRKRHARGKVSITKHRQSNYFVRLEEGKPPKEFYVKPLAAGEQMFKEWMQSMHERKITNSL